MVIFMLTGRTSHEHTLKNKFRLTEIKHEFGHMQFHSWISFCKCVIHKERNIYIIKKAASLKFSKSLLLRLLSTITTIEPSVQVNWAWRLTIVLLQSRLEFCQLPL
jgi:hypothetical protein